MSVHVRGRPGRARSSDFQHVQSTRHAPRVRQSTPTNQPHKSYTHHHHHQKTDHTHTKTTKPHFILFYFILFFDQLFYFIFKFEFGEIFFIFWVFPIFRLPGEKDGQNRSRL
jgi:hypothetical protein